MATDQVSKMEEEKRFFMATDQVSKMEEAMKPLSTCRVPLPTLVVASRRLQNLDLLVS